MIIFNFLFLSLFIPAGIIYIYPCRELAHEFLQRPIKVTIGSDDLAAGTRIKQVVEVIDDRAREARLAKLLKAS